MLSVIIPVYNNNDQLYLTLTSLAEQTLPQNLYEVFIIDDGSDIKADTVVQQFNSKIKNLRYIYQENGGRAKARNGARNLLRGKIIVFTDADRIPHPKFLEMHYEFHKEKKNENSLCIGEAKEIYFTNILEKKDKIFEIVRSDSRLAKKINVHKVLYSMYDSLGNTKCSVPWLTTFSGNMSLSRHLLDEEIGWFDEAFIQWGFEHFELGYRLYKSGVSFKFNKDAINYHIAHKRESGSLITAMEESHTYFLQKHPNKEIRELLSFMKGDISLQQFDDIARGSFNSQTKIEKPLYINIIN